MKNYTIKHVKNSDYIIKVKDVKNDCNFTFSHFFARMNLNSNSIAVYKSEKSVVLIREVESHNSRDDKAIYLSKNEWSKLVAKTDDMNDAQSLEFLLKKFFWYKDETIQEQEERE